MYVTYARIILLMTATTQSTSSFDALDKYIWFCCVGWLIALRFTFHLFWKQTNNTDFIQRNVIHGGDGGDGGGNVAIYLWILIWLIQEKKKQ